MHRFFVEKEQISGGTVRITGPDVRHIRSVLRMKKDEKILVACGDEWEYTCALKYIGEDMVTAEICDAQKPAKELPSRIYVFQCLPKGDKMETVIQKAVELGAYEIVPVVSSRCVVRLDAKKSIAKVNRWNAIAASAAKQSKRMIIPSVHGVMTYQKALDFAQMLDVRLIPYEREEGMEKTRRLIEAIEPGQSVGILIGPEGGFESAEVDSARTAGFESISLGRRILRTETAAMTLLSVLMFKLEE